jgi:large subunit ribosomal protein L24
MVRIKKDDMVAVLSGKDNGKTGKVIEILPKKGKVKIKGIALVKKHVKARRQGETGGIKEVEAYLDASKVMPICASCNHPTRVSVKHAEAGKKARMCNRCKEIF